MRRYICKVPGCRELCEKPGYCVKHQKDAAFRRNTRKPFENAVRANQELYRTSQWKQLKRIVIKEHPSCYFCGVSKEDAGGLDVHHLVPPRGDADLFFDRNNLVPVCYFCHERLTAREIQERKNK